MKAKRFDSSDNNVWKYVFDFEDAVAEAVLYKYGTFEERTVLCVSVQSGCPVGCKFCGTGKKFIRNLTADEIVGQVVYCLENMEIPHISDASKRFQIMFMSMGEPMLNINQVYSAVHRLNAAYRNAELLISTVGIKDTNSLKHLFRLSEEIDKVGLQFSIHEAFDKDRDELIPFKNKMSLREIREVGIKWNALTDRPVYLNYCVSESNSSDNELNRLMDLFPPSIFNFTFSVICSEDENMKEKGFNDLVFINEVSDMFLKEGYNVRVFDPAGQDDIGGGCGQLWYVQDWMNKHNK